MKVKPSVVRTIADLRATLAYHAKRYRIDLEPEITDTQYDDLKSQLAGLERRYPEEALTATVESDLMSAQPVKHRYPMLSIQSTKNMDELLAFARPIIKDYKAVLVEHKLDGVAVSVRYKEGGKRENVVLRGDGLAGDSVLNVATYIDSIPESLPSEILREYLGVTPDKAFEVRGEIVVLREDFNRYNKQAEEKGWRRYTNPRAAAAGGIRRRDKHNLLLTFIAYDLLAEVDQPPTIPTTSILTALGFRALASVECKNEKELEEAVRAVEAARQDLSYDIDGVVIKAPEGLPRQALGETHTHPKWAMAFKYASKEAFAKIVDVVYQTGRTGRVTPVLKVEPTPIDGITVSSVTLHNFSRFLKIKPAMGDIAVIHRANDVGPQLIKTIAKGENEPFKIHPYCNCCGTELVLSGTSDIQCPNRLNCSVQAIASLVHFVSPIALNIQLFGPQRVEALYRAGKLKTPADFFRLTPRDLTAVGASQSMAIKLIHEIDRRKTTTLPRILTGLGIDQVSFLTASAIAKAFHYDLETIAHAKKEAFKAIDKIDEIKANLIERFFATNYEAVMDLLNQGLSWPREQPESLPLDEQLLRNVSMVITGRFTLESGQEISRPRVWDHYHRLGAHITENVGPNTHYVVVGNNPSPNKITKAEKLNVVIVSQEEFKTRFSLPPFILPID